MNTPRSPQAWKIQNDPLSNAASGPVLRLVSLTNAMSARRDAGREASQPCTHPELIRGSIAAFSWQRLLSCCPCEPFKPKPSRQKSKQTKARVSGSAVPHVDHEHCSSAHYWCHSCTTGPRAAFVSLTLHFRPPRAPTTASASLPHPQTVHALSEAK